MSESDKVTCNTTIFISKGDILDTDKLIQKALTAVSKHLHNYQSSSNTKFQKKASVLSYWLCDYMRMLKREETFIPGKLKKYKRGEIVKVHLGYNIGSEQGGLHYAIVLDNNNKRSDSTVTVVPLSSVKNNDKPLYHARVPLGNTIFLQLQEKLNTQNAILKETIAKNNAEIDSLLEDIRKDTGDDNVIQMNGPKLNQRIQDLNRSVQSQTELLKSNDKITKEISKMKSGSVALVNQITTVSKIRIYNPLYSNDALSKIRVSDDLLNLIDDKIKELYLGK